MMVTSHFIVAALINLAQIQPPDIQSARTQAASTEAFLAFKAEQQRQQSRRIVDAANLRDLNGLVRAAGLRPPRPRFVSDAVALAQLEQAFLVDVAQSLALFGFKAGNLRRDPAAGEALVSAAAARLRGSATLRQETLLADTVVIGSIAQTSEAPAEDGYRSTLGIRVEESIKGGFRPGEVVAVRRLSGSDGTGRMVTVSSEADFATGTRVALVASRAAYADPNRGQGCRSCVVEQVPIFLVSGEVLTPTGGYLLSGRRDDLR